MPRVEIKCQGATTFPITGLVEFQGNLKTLSKENYEKLKKEITELGFSEPISVWKSDQNYILNGHQRIRTLLMMMNEGFDIPDIPVSLIEADSIKEAKKKVLALTSQYGQMTNDGLYEFLINSDIRPEEIVDTRFPEINMEEFLQEFFVDKQEEQRKEEIEDYVPEEVEPVCKTGQIWKLGNHRLMCGDATKDVENLMAGEKADMVFTDPPYGYEYESNYQTKHKMLQNDDKILNFIPIAFEATAQNATLYLCTSHQVIDKWKPLVTGFDYKNLIVWKKNNWSMGDLKGAFAGQHELIIFASKGNNSIIGKRDTDIWSFDRTPPKLHPTQKTVELIEYAMSKWQSGKVLDLFGGSGSTLIACEKTNRRCFMMEIDPHYCDVIISRWENYANQKAELTNG